MSRERFRRPRSRRLLRTWRWLLSGQDSTGTGSGTVGWTFSAADSAFDFLAEGEKLVITYNISVDDGEGGGRNQPVTITVFGANDAPAFAVGGSHITGSTEDATTLTIVGEVAFSDADRSDLHGVSVAANPATPGNLGTLTAGVLTDTTGTGAGGVVGWGYTVSESDVHALAAGETRTDSFIITLGDDHTATTTQIVALTLLGENDAPVITAEDLLRRGDGAPDAARQLVQQRRHYVQRRRPHRCAPGVGTGTRPARRSARSRPSRTATPTGSGARRPADLDLYGGGGCG